MRALARIGWRAAPGPTAAMLVLSLLGGACGFVIPLLTGQAVGQVPSLVDRGITTTFVLTLAGLLVALVVSSLTSTLGDAAAGITDGLVSHAVELRIGWAQSSRPDLTRLEDQEASRAIQVVRARVWELGSAHVTLFSLLPNQLVVLVGGAVSLGVVLTWWAPLVLLTPLLLAAEHARRSGLSQMRVFSDRGEDQLHAASAFAQGMGKGAKEIRVFGLTDLLLARMEHHNLASYRPYWRRRQISAGIGLGWALAQSGAVLVVTTWAVLAYGSGALGLTQVAAALPLVVALTRVDLSSLGQVSRAAAATRTLDTVAAPEEWTEAAPRIAVDPRAASEDDLVGTIAQVHQVPPPGGPPPEIVFDDVGFHYPGQPTPVLDGVDLVLPAGGASALVGVNGAGKSTLVKLLAAAYRPTSGRILVDGEDLADLDEEGRASWQRRIAPISQEFLRLPLSIGDNVELGSGRVWSGIIESDHYPDPAALDRAARRAGITDLVAGLELRWATPLDKTMPGGTDLSGGEWQRVGLARALRAVDAGARVLILDEPAAALDVESESRLVAGYLDVARATTSLIISHRFSVVRPVDHIHVLARGRIVESGSHDELMTAPDGVYRGLFSLQAARYAEATGEPS